MSYFFFCNELINTSIDLLRNEIEFFNVIKKRENLSSILMKRKMIENSPVKSNQSLIQFQFKECICSGRRVI
jgi:hypothetical protein